MAKVPPQTTDPFRARADAPPPEPAFALPDGTEVGPYTIEALLHEGPYGFVYRVRDAAGQGSALKEFFPRRLALRGEDGAMRARQAGDAIPLAVAMEAFRDEARILEAVRHPGLIAVQGTVAAFRTLFRAMPLVDGPTLAQHVSQRVEPPTVAEVRAFLDAMMGPLGALHRAGVVHGNLCPEQILLAAGAGAATPVLLGLGAVAEEIDGPASGPWTAPERRERQRGGRLTSAADLYALAACAWFLATGERPPSAAAREDGLPWRVREGLDALREDTTDPPEARAALGQALETALAMVPEARPQRVADLQRLLAGRPAVRLVDESAPAPLWVGEAPDREAQRSTVEALPPQDVALPVADEVPPPVVHPARTRWGALAAIAVAALALAWVASRLFGMR